VVQGAPDCQFIGWHVGNENADGQVFKDSSEPDCDEAIIPPHIVGLTLQGEECALFLIDTQLGVIYWPECPGEVRNMGALLEDEPFDWAEDGLIPEDQMEWRENSAFWAIEDFFEMLKLHFATLNFVPVGRRRVEGMYPWIRRSEEDQEILAAIQKIYREYGWPEKNKFCKDDCLAEIEAMISARFPNANMDFN